MEKMSILKVLMIINYGFRPFDLNFELLEPEKNHIGVDLCCFLWHIVESKTTGFNTTEFSLGLVVVASGPV